MPRSGGRLGPAGATPCQSGRKRASAAGSTGSTSRRSRASDRRRRRRRTSGSHHSRSAPPGRNSPRSSEPAPSSRSSASSTTPTGRPQRRAGSGVRNGPWRPRPAGQQPVERTRGRPEEGGRDADRRRDPDPVAIAGDVLDREPAVVARDPGPDRPAGRGELVEPRPGGRQAALGPGGHLGGRQVAEPAEQVVDAVERRRLPVVGQRLEAQLEIGQRVRVEQLAQLLLAEQLAQQVAVERERAGPPLGDRRVAVVHVGGDVVEHEARRERRGAAPSRRRGWRSRGGRRRPGSRAGPAGRRRPTGTRGTSRPGSGTSRSARRPRAGRPTAGAAARAASACPAGVAAGAGPGPRSRGSGWRTCADVASVPTTRSSTSSGSGNSSASMPSSGASPSGSRIAMPSSDQIVWTSSPSRSPIRASSASDHGAWTRPPNGRQQAQPPVAELVAEALDDDPLVGRQGARRLALVVEVGEQVGGGALVEVVRLAQPGRRGGPALAPRGEVRLELADEGADRPAELDRPADRVALPERQLAGHARRRA